MVCFERRIFERSWNGYIVVHFVFVPVGRHRPVCEQAESPRQNPEGGLGNYQAGKQD